MHLLQAFCLTLTRTVRYSIHTRDPIWYGTVDITDPGTSVMLWDGKMVPRIPVCPWQSIPIAWGLNIKAYRRRPNLGHAMLAWYAGPSASLDNKDTKKQFIDYRIFDYWAGFWSEGDMYKLMRRRLQVTSPRQNTDFGWCSRRSVTIFLFRHVTNETRWRKQWRRRCSTISWMTFRLIIL
jgi:hypothetical protein